MNVLRTFVWFCYFFGYMIVHLPALRRAENALKQGDEATYKALAQKHVTQWCTTLLHLAGVELTVEGKENIPEGNCIFAANHRSYYDIPVTSTLR